MSEAEHHRWMMERQAMGWTLGKVRDPIARWHPDLIPWGKLDDAIREKDRELVRKIPAMVARSRRAIRRERIIHAVDGRPPRKRRRARCGSARRAGGCHLRHPRAGFVGICSGGRAEAAPNCGCCGTRAAIAPLAAPSEVPAALRDRVELAISEREAAALKGAPAGKTGRRFRQRPRRRQAPRD